MNPKELLTTVEEHNLLDGLTKFTTCRLKVSTKHRTTADQIRKDLEAFAPNQGWLCFQNEIVRFIPGEVLPDKGVILYGEIMNVDDQALHIQQDGVGGWRIAYFSEEQGDTHLVEDHLLMTDVNPDQPSEPRYNLNYRVYWAQDGEQGYRQVASSFNGFRKV